MIEITKAMSKYLFNANQEVFLLYEDGTESVANNLEEIMNHEQIFGREND